MIIIGKELNPKQKCTNKESHTLNGSQVATCQAFNGW